MNELQVGDPYRLPPPQPLDRNGKNAFLRATMQRFASFSSSGSAVVDAAVAVASGSGRLARGPPPAEMGILLMIRTVTRAQRDSSGRKESARVKNENEDEDGAAMSEEDVWMRNDLLRSTILDYVLEDLPGR